MEAQSNRSTWYSLIALVAIVAFFCVFMAGYFVPSYDGVDENGYILAAKHLAVSGTSAKHTTHPLEYVSENVVQVGEGLFYAKYPLGYPWLCALAFRMGGAAAVFWVNPILAALAVVGMFLLGRALVNDWAGALAAILLATNSLHAFYGLSAVSHSGAICFAIWGMFFLWRWTQSGGWGNAALAGALTAYTCTIRYSEALLALPVVAMIAWRWREAKRAEILVMAAAAGAVLLPMALHHWAAFGAPWRTGYALCGEATGFGWKWFTKNWWVMLTRFNAPGLLLMFPLGLVGLGYLAVHDLKRATLLGLWALPAMLLYTAYYWAPDGDGPGYIRFFVSVFPALIVAGLVLVCEPFPPRWEWTVVLGAFVVLAATANLRDAMQQIDKRADRLRFVQQTWEVVQRRLPADAVVVSSGRVLNYLEYAGDFAMYSTEAFDRNAIKNRTKILNDRDPHPFQRRKAETLAQTLGDKSDDQLAGMQRALLSSNIAEGRVVALIANRDEFRKARGRLGGDFQYDPLTEWLDVTRGRDNEVRTTSWTLYGLRPRPKESTAVQAVALEEKVDQLQFKAKTLRDEFDARYPGAQQRWTEINDLEKQLREAQDQLKKLAARKPPPKLAAPAVDAGGPAPNSQKAELRP